MPPTTLFILRQTLSSEQPAHLQRLHNEAVGDEVCPRQEADRVGGARGAQHRRLPHVLEPRHLRAEQVLAARRGIL